MVGPKTNPEWRRESDRHSGGRLQSRYVKRMFAETKQVLGLLHTLVNNVGVYEFASFDTITEQDFHRYFNINVLGPILTTQEALKYFPPSGGSIINISSIASENPVPNSSLYAATKGAIDTLTMALSKELGLRNIRVNTVAPGLIDTEGNRASGFVGSAAAPSAAAVSRSAGRRCRLRSRKSNTR